MEMFVIVIWYFCDFMDTVLYVLLGAAGGFAVLDGSIQNLHICVALIHSISSSVVYSAFCLAAVEIFSRKHRFRRGRHCRFLARLESWNLLH